MTNIKIDLWTSQHCSYCTPAKRLAKRLVEQFPDVKLSVRVIEDDEAGAVEAKLSAVPTWILSNGRDNRRIVGVASLVQLSEEINRLGV